MSRFAFFYESAEPLFDEAADRGREWFGADEGFGNRRLPKLRDPKHQLCLAILMNKRWEQRNPERAKELHRRATAAWKARDPGAFAASNARRKKRYQLRHADKVREANRASYLRWRAKPGNIEAARQRADRRRAA